MKKRTRRTHSSAFKAKVALDAVQRREDTGRIGQQFDVHPNQITQWKNQLLTGAPDVFGGEALGRTRRST